MHEEKEKEKGSVVARAEHRGETKKWMEGAAEIRAVVMKQPGVVKAGLLP